MLTTRILWTNFQKNRKNLLKYFFGLFKHFILWSKPLSVHWDHFHSFKFIRPDFIEQNVQENTLKRLLLACYLLFRSFFSLTTATLEWKHLVSLEALDFRKPAEGVYFLPCSLSREQRLLRFCEHSISHPPSLCQIVHSFIPNRFLAVWARFLWSTFCFSQFVSRHRKFVNLLFWHTLYVYPPVNMWQLHSHFRAYVYWPT